MFRVSLSAALMLFVCASAVAAPAHLDRVYAFGDSYTDDGAGYGATRAMVAHGIAKAQAKPGGLYWQQRWSNGPVTVEVMARTLGLALSDYAIGGAKSGRDNYYPWMNKAWPTGTLAQVADYLAHQPAGQADPNGLYFVFASANDFFAHEDFREPMPIPALAAQAAANVAAAVEELAAAGAKHVVVVGSVDLTHVPAVVAGHQQQDAAAFQSRFDTRLHRQVKKMASSSALQVSWFDHVAFARRIRAHADRYGLVDLDSPCQRTYPKAGPRCAHPATHYYWDEWHPTHHVHTLAGRAIAALVQREQTGVGDKH